MGSFFRVLAVVGCAGSLMLTAGCQSTGNDQKIDTGVSAPEITFDDAVEIDNGVVRLAVSPGVGRAVAFGYVGEENLLWINTTAIYDGPANENTYYNIGGDKLWPAPQPLWKSATGHNQWPPDGVIDGGPWTLVEATDNEITIGSAPSPDYGVVATRTFTLKPNRAQVVITNTLTRTEANPHPVQLWTVTQIKEPQTAVLDVAGDAPDMPAAFVKMTDETPAKVEGRVKDLSNDDAATWPKAVEWTQAGDAHAKLGSLGRWVAAVYDDVIFRQETAFDPEGAYPEVSSVQVYRAGKYTELELLSPMVQLGAGESVSNTVTWALIKMNEEFDANAFLIAADPN